MRVRTVLITAVVLSTLGSPTSGFLQSPSSSLTPTGAVTGRVVDALTGAVLQGAVVTLLPIVETVAREPATPRGRRFVTRSDGRYAFRDLASGRYVINATRSGYLFGGVGARRPGGRRQLLVLAEGEKIEAPAIALWKEAAISGVVLDEGGEPVFGARVRALRHTPLRGREFGGESWATTDDRGFYRLFGLPPGDYLVAVPPVLFEGALVYPLTFYPSAQVPEAASLVTVAPGGDRTGVDFQLAPASGVRVNGTVANSHGPVGGIPLTLRLPDAEFFPFMLEVASTVSGPAGEFSFDDVSAGTYVLQAAERRRGTAGSPRTAVRDEHGSSTIVVNDRDLDDLLLQLRPGAPVSGRLIFEGGVQPLPSLYTGTRVYLDRLDERSSGAEPATPDGIGRFTTAALPPGRYRLRVGVIPIGWMFKGAMYGGRNIADEPFELESHDITGVVVTFTTQGTRVSGVVRADDGQPDPETSVAVYPADRTLWTPTASIWRMHSVRASINGTYTVSSLPPGDYYFIALPEEQVVNWHHPQRLAELAPYATRVRVLEGQVQVHDLRTVRGR